MAHQNGGLRVVVGKGLGSSDSQFRQELHGAIGLEAGFVQASASRDWRMGYVSRCFHPLCAFADGLPDRSAGDE